MNRLGIFLCFSLIVLKPISSYADTWTASLFPGAAISAPAGQTVGWGYQITNNSTSQWLVLENLTENPFQNVTSLDSVFDFPILAPGQSIMESYVQGNSGLLGVTWAANAPDYYVNSGNFVLSADWYSGDPFAGGSDAGAAAQQTLSYTVQVTPSSSPEPEMVKLLLSGIALLWLARAVLSRRTVKSKSQSL
jgi:hypothetical protein